MAGKEKAVLTEGNKKRKSRRTGQAITVSYINEMPGGVLEKALADIYAKKIKGGTLRDYTP